MSFLRNVSTGQGAKRDVFESTLVERVQLSGGCLAFVGSGIAVIRLFIMHNILQQQSACTCLYVQLAPHTFNMPTSYLVPIIVGVANERRTLVGLW